MDFWSLLSTLKSKYRLFLMSFSDRHRRPSFTHIVKLKVVQSGHLAAAWKAKGHLPTLQIFRVYCLPSWDYAQYIQNMWSSYIKRSLFLASCWAALFNTCSQEGLVPTRGIWALLALISKGKNHLKQPSRFRGIAIEICFFKLLNLLLTQRYSEFLWNRKVTQLHYVRRSYLLLFPVRT